MTTIGEERIALEVAEIPEALKAAPSDPEAPIAGEPGGCPESVVGAG